MAPIQYPQLHDVAWLTLRYVEQRMSAQAIADEIGATKFAVYNALQKHGIERRRHSSKFWQLNDKAWLREHYVDKRLSTVQIAEMVGSTVGNVASHLKAAAVPLRSSKQGIAVRYPNGRNAEEAANWRGGRRVRGQNGYIQVYAPDHPRAGRDKAVFEHILVAEETLGRYLEPGEIVHHINENKQDNRSENLEVKTRSDHVKEHYGNGRLLRERVEALEARVADLEARLNGDA